MDWTARCTLKHKSLLQKMNAPKLEYTTTRRNSKSRSSRRKHVVIVHQCLRRLPGCIPCRRIRRSHMHRTKETEGETERERERYRQTDGRTEGRTDRQTDSECAAGSLPRRTPVSCTLPGTTHKVFRTYQRPAVAYPILSGARAQGFGSRVSVRWGFSVVSGTSCHVEAAAWKRCRCRPASAA